jgi:two-component system nitrate/nitrite response regulator NarL
VNLLICDDHRLLAECLAALFAARGHRVVATAHHPDDAVRIVAGAGDDADSLHVDVCVIDLTFSDSTFSDSTISDGRAYGAIRDIRASSPTTEVVVLSGSAQPFAELLAFEAGAAAFVLKDHDVSRVIDAVERVDRDDSNLASMSRGEVDGAPPVPERSGGTGLTRREREVLQRLVSGERTRTIAAEMGVSYSTARTHVQNLLHKLGVHSRLEAVAFALSHSLVRVGDHVG